MIKQEIIEKISKYFKLTSFEAEKIYDDIFSGIIKGVKEENIADVTNLGEFIIKYNSGDEKNKKTVEFLPTLSLEEEINQRVFEENIQPESVKKESLVNEPLVNDTVPVQSVMPQEEKPPVQPESQKPEEKTVEEFTPKEIKAEELTAEEHLSVEEEIRRKRDEILSKMIKPKDQVKITENLETPVVPPIVEMIGEKTEPQPVIDEFKSVKEEKIEEINRSAEDITDKADELNSEAEKLRLQAEELTSKAEELKKKANELSSTSFDDYFTEIKEPQKTFNATVTPPPVIESTVVPPVENVIPPSAVELHNQITGDINKTTEPQQNEYQTTITPGPLVNGNGNGNGYEHKLQDNSYYIWYKDSEPNASDTQTMSYEYELLYQATKDAEYKSKLRIYVTTFIMFFSIVLILLIFSPVIYKFFFTPSEDTNTEQVQDETSQSNEPQNTDRNNQASVNSLDEQKPADNNSTTQQNTTQQSTTQQSTTQQSTTQQNTSQQNTEKPVNTPPVTENKKKEEPAKEQPKKEQPKKEEPKQQVIAKQEKQKKQVAKQNEPAGNQNLAGVQKTSMGWIDDQNKVIYVQLENGKFTIQESAWDSDAKANKRISSVGALIPGLKGSVQKVDLGGKGTWYRARFGEFTTLEEAVKKAEELRSRERNRLQALLLTFLLYG